MAQFHFVQDYVKHVKRLKRKYPIDKAMSLAVGGNYETISDVASDILIEAGLSDGHRLFDFGCGSGRVAVGVARKRQLAGYLGVDIVQDLLDYARTKTPPEYRFLINRSLKLPAEDASFDFVCAFSVFTHLLLHESYTYLCEMERIVRPGGRVVISFLELAAPEHVQTFKHTAEMSRKSKLRALNSFTERNQLAVMGREAGLEVERFIDANKPVSESGALGQSVVIYQKPT